MLGVAASVLGALAVLAAGSIAAAAEIEVYAGDKPDDLVVISIDGEIKSSDTDRFKKIALQHDDALVVLNSEGGAIYPAIEIGRIIRIKGYATLVSSDEICTSACALIWLAGSKRGLGDKGRIGFHASYVEEKGKARESGVGNALVGSYLASLSLPEEAIIFATMAKPDAINWLTPDNAAAIGIPISLIPEDGGDEPAPPILASGAVKDEAAEDATPYAEVEGWAVMVDPSLNHGCFIYTSYDGGVGLRVGIDRSDGTQNRYVMLFGKAWESLKEGDTYALTLVLNEQKPITKDFVAIDLDGLKGLMRFEPENEFWAAFAVGRGLQVEYKGKSVSKLETTGATAAIGKMIECQTKQPNAGDPFAQ